MRKAYGIAHEVGLHVQDGVLPAFNEKRQSHGSSADRKRWFKIGYDTGDAGSCDPF